MNKIKGNLIFKKTREIRVLLITENESKQIRLKNLIFQCSSIRCKWCIKIDERETNQVFSYEEIIKNSFLEKINGEKPLDVFSEVQFSWAKALWGNIGEHEIFDRLRKILCNFDKNPLRCYYLDGKDKYPIDFSLLSGDSFVIGLTGPTSSGKTMYLRALWHELGDFALKLNAVPMLRPNETYRSVEKDLRKLLRLSVDESGHLPLPTQIRDTIMVYNLIVQQGCGGVWPHQDKPIKIITRDTAGEVLFQLQDMEKALGYFVFANSLLFLLDPGHCATFKDKVQGTENERVQAIHQPIADLVGFYNDRLNHIDRGEISIAVVLSKCDGFEDNFPKPLKNALRRANMQKSCCTIPTKNDLETISEEFIKYLRNCNDPDLERMIKALRAFGSVAFFPVTSTGTEVKWVGEKPLPLKMEVNRTVSFQSQGDEILRNTKLADNSDEGVEEEANDTDFKKKGKWMTNKPIKPRYVDFPVFWLYHKYLENR